MHLPPVNRKFLRRPGPLPMSPSGKNGTAHCPPGSKCPRRARRAAPNHSEPRRAPHRTSRRAPRQHQRIAPQSPPPSAQAFEPAPPREPSGRHKPAGCVSAPAEANSKQEPRRGWHKPAVGVSRRAAQSPINPPRAASPWSIRPAWRCDSPAATPIVFRSASRARPPCKLAVGFVPNSALGTDPSQARSPNSQIFCHPTTIPDSVLYERIHTVLPAPLLEIRPANWIIQMPGRTASPPPSGVPRSGAS